MKPAPFDYHAPQSLEEAAALLTELGDGAKLLGGGQSLIPMLALRLTVFDHLVDLGRIAELRGIERRNGSSVDRGRTRPRRPSEGARRWPRQRRSSPGHTPLIGHFQIRNRGTIGGSIAHADPSAEYPAVALALDAEHRGLLFPSGRRTIPAAQFFDRPVEHRTGRRRDPHRHQLPGVERPLRLRRRGDRPPPRRLRHRRGGGRPGARRRRPDPALRHRPDRLWGRHPNGPAPPKRRSSGRRWSTSIRPTWVIRRCRRSMPYPRICTARSEYRTRVGSVMVERAWRSASEEARSG